MFISFKQMRKKYKIKNQKNLKKNIYIYAVIF